MVGLKRKPLKFKNAAYQHRQPKFDSVGPTERGQVGLEADFVTAWPKTGQPKTNIGRSFRKKSVTMSYENKVTVFCSNEQLDKINLHFDYRFS